MAVVGVQSVMQISNVVSLPRCKSGTWTHVGYGGSWGSALAAVEHEAWRLEVQQNVGVQESRSIAHRIHSEVGALVSGSSQFGSFMSGTPLC